MIKIIFSIAAYIILCTSTITAQDFSYEPINPSFGGNTFNYNWLLSSAQAQNGTTDPDAASSSSRFQRDPIEDFESSLNRQILNQLSRNLLSDQFGTDGTLDAGTFTVGNFTIDIVPGLEATRITIIDLTTGGQSIIEVPNL